MRLRLISFLLLISVYGQAQDVTSFVSIKAKRDIYVYKVPNFEDPYIADSLFEGSLLLGTSYFQYKYYDNEAKKNDSMGCWHICYIGNGIAKSGYVLDANYELSYDMDERNTLKALGLQNDSARFQSVKTILTTAYKNVKAKEAQYKSHGLEITNTNLEYPNKYSSFPGWSVSFVNHAGKTIKYIWFHVAAINAVGDVIYNSGQQTVSLKGIGPVEPGAAGGYDFEHVIYSKVVDHITLKKVVIQYMDGTTKTITNVKAIGGES